MIVRDARRLALILGLVAVFFYASYSILGLPSGSWPGSDWFGHTPEPSPQSEDASADNGGKGPPLPPSDMTLDDGDGDGDGDELDGPSTLLAGTPSSTHTEIFSVSTRDGKFFPIDFDKTKTLNPNILPHPTKDNVFIIVAQKIRENKMSEFKEIICDAVFRDGGLRCINPPSTLPIAPTTGRRCKGEHDYFNLNIGPHDARVFLGPERPYTIFGSNSLVTCFGQFIQDLGHLVDWDGASRKDEPATYGSGTEIKRPPPWNEVEKNFFLFWDSQGQVYAHYDIAPKRAFAQIGPDGSAGSDLAAVTRDSDSKCLAKYLPKLAPQHESLHQATNSLSVTMCSRAETGCIRNDDNTFILTIYQHKKFYDLHAVYEPYVVLFRRRPPFDLVAMSRRPLWIHGRQIHPERKTSDMFYMTSVSWKDRRNRYHGYIDDELFLAFGIEDKKTAGIDVRASDILSDIGMCFEAS